MVIGTTNDSAYALASDLRAAGVKVAAVVDARSSLTPVAAAAVEAGTRVLIGSAVADTASESDAASADGRLASVTVRSINDDGELTSGIEEIACDLLAVSGGWSPLVHLHSQRQGKLRWDEDLAAFVPSTVVPNQQTIGSGRGSFELEDCLAEGISAGAAAAIAAGFEPEKSDAASSLWSFPSRKRPVRPASCGWSPGRPAHRMTGTTTSSTSSATSPWPTSCVPPVPACGPWSTSSATPPSAPRTTRARPRASTRSASSRRHSGRPAKRPGASATSAPPPTGRRSPPWPSRHWPDASAANCSTPPASRRSTRGTWRRARCSRTSGQWKRPWYYPQGGEDMDAAVLRECAAVRESVGFMDATTLGKIEIRGKDAGEFLNRIYTNAFKKLAPGSARYGVMCLSDGMIFDDGVTLRLDEDRYFMTTTTGGAAKVLDWLEEWLQTEWPELDVHCTSVTEQWSTIAVVGPKSRAVIAKVAPELAADGGLDAEAFPFMTFRETTLASGVQARICRISFSGELAYEINVPSWYGLNTWEAVAAAGAEFNITPYGTETMHVLRAEKGYPIVGQDTDGTVTPQDAGMEWIVSKAKDFIGKRSYSRVDAQREDRKHLVSVLPVDGSLRLPEGTQLVEKGIPANPAYGPVPMQGFVTSSYHSAALGRSFGLALIKNGRNRIGETLVAAAGDQLVDVVVAETVLFDPEGTRKDG